MEELSKVITEIFQIEKRANTIMGNAMEEKSDLTRYYEDETQKFDANLKAKTDDTIAKIKDEFHEQMSQALSKQRDETNQRLLSLETEYENNHIQLANNILNSIIGA